MESQRITHVQPGWLAQLRISFGTLVTITLLVCTLGGLGWAVVLNRMDSEIRKQLQTQLSNHYVNHRVRIRSARRIEGQGIEIRGVSIASPARPGEPLLFIDEIFVDCNAEVADLVAGKLQPRQVIVRRAKVRASRRPDGSWDVSDLLSTPQLSPHQPPLQIESAELMLIDPEKSAEPFFHVRDVSLVLAKEQLAASATQSPHDVLRLQGEFRSEYAEHVTFGGEFNLDGISRFRGQVDSLHASQKLFRLLPAEIQHHFQTTSDLSGEVDFGFHITKAADAPLEFSVTDGVVRNGRITDQRLPSTLTQVAGTFSLTNQQCQGSLTAKMGDTQIYAEGRLDGLHPGGQWDVHTRLRNLELTEHLFDVLPPFLQGEWRKFSPAGNMHVDANLSNRSGRIVVSNGWFQCIDASFSHFRFPYRVEHASGLIRMEDRELWTENLQAYAGSQIVRINAHLFDLGPRAYGTTTIRTDGPVPLDQRVIAAIPGQARHVIASLEPSGFIHLQGMRIERQDPNAPKFSTSIELEVTQGSVRYHKFQYPINKISGRITAQDDQWTFHDLIGYHSSAYITCNGQWTPPQGEAGAQLTLDFTGTDVPLDDELRLALSERERNIWSQINPRGTLDYVAVRLQFDVRIQSLSLGVVAEKRPQSQNLAGRSITLKPSWFPLPLGEVTGVVRFDNGTVHLENVRAKHADMDFQIAGTTQVFPDGTWSAKLTQVVAERLEPTHAFLNALPPVLANSIAQLRLSGPFNMNGQLAFSGNNQPGSVPTAEWDVRFDVYDGKMATRIPYENIHGSVTLKGRHDSKATWSRGELAIDSMMFHGAQFVNVRGPLWIDSQNVFLGKWAEREPLSATQRHVTADLLGGSFQLNAWMQLRANTPFRIECALQHGDLATIAREAFQQSEELRGVTHATLRIEGNALGPHTYRGDGTLRLRDAQIYETPVMLALLSRLSITEPQSQGDTVDVDYRIQGEHLYFDRVEFRGTAISLYGKEAGWMNLHGGMAMKFYAKVGRTESPFWLINRMMHEIGRQVLEIEVTGTIDNPEVTNKPFPELDETLQMIFNEDPAERLPPVIPTLGTARNRTNKRTSTR